MPPATAGRQFPLKPNSEDSTLKNRTETEPVEAGKVAADLPHWLYLLSLR